MADHSISFLTNLRLEMGWLIDKGTWVLPVYQLHSEGLTCNHHSHFWRSLPQSRGVAKWHGWVRWLFLKSARSYIRDSEKLISHILENYRSGESFEEHFVLKLILVSTVFKFPIQFSYLHLTEVFLSIYKEISNFNVTYALALRYIVGFYIHTFILIIFFPALNIVPTNFSSVYYITTCFGILLFS